MICSYLQEGCTLNPQKEEIGLCCCRVITEKFWDMLKLVLLCVSVLRIVLNGQFPKDNKVLVPYSVYLAHWAIAIKGSILRVIGEQYWQYC